MTDSIPFTAIGGMDFTDITEGPPLPPLAPGEVLPEAFLKPYSLSANRFAQALGVPPNRISAIVNGDRAITADTAILFAHSFGTTPQFWLNLQTHYDLQSAERAVTPDRIARATALARTLWAA